MSDLTREDLEILNSDLGLRLLFAREDVDPARALRQARYELELKALQLELVRLQAWVIETGGRVALVFEGRDAAGKGGAIRRIVHRINPRHYRVVALNKPSEDEARQWYFQRYVETLPRPGEIVLYDRSWYNRAGVEPVNGFCTNTQYERFMGQVNDFERMITESGITLVKFYFSISKREQARRFEAIERDPRKRWKITPVDRRAQELWDVYTKYKKKMFAVSDTELCPWTIIDADSKRAARLEAIRHILARIPYRQGAPEAGA